MSRDTVRIVLATYNGETYLREQLDSLLGQTHRDFVVEVCDDGSADGTSRIVREYQRRDERIRLHENGQNTGYVKNFLEGIKRSKEPYIMLCDQDDIWNPDKIEVTLRAMKREESARPGQPVLVYTDAVNFDSGTGKTAGNFHKNSHLDTKKVDTAHLFMENKIIGCTAMLNGAVLPYLQDLPEEIRVHDWWLALICSHFGGIAYVEEPTLLYRQHSGNMIGGTSFMDYVKNRLAGIRRQREVLHASYLQGQAFLRVFGSRMDRRQREIAEAFAGMDGAGWFQRRYRAFRYGFTKSGFVRNVGLFLLL